MHLDPNPLLEFMQLVRGTDATNDKPTNGIVRITTTCAPSEKIWRCGNSLILTVRAGFLNYQIRGGDHCPTSDCLMLKVSFNPVPVLSCAAPISRERKSSKEPLIDSRPPLASTYAFDSPRRTSPATAAYDPHSGEQLNRHPPKANVVPAILTSRDAKLVRAANHSNYSNRRYFASPQGFERARNRDPPPSRRTRQLRAPVVVAGCTRTSASAARIAFHANSARGLTKLRPRYSRNRHSPADEKNQLRPVAEQSRGVSTTAHLYRAATQGRAYPARQSERRDNRRCNAQRGKGSSAVGPGRIADFLSRRRQRTSTPRRKTKRGRRPYL